MSYHPSVGHHQRYSFGYPFTPPLSMQLLLRSYYTPHFQISNKSHSFYYIGRGLGHLLCHTTLLLATTNDTPLEGNTASHGTELLFPQSHQTPNIQFSNKIPSFWCIVRGFEHLLGHLLLILTIVNKKLLPACLGSQTGLDRPKMICGYAIPGVGPCRSFIPLPHIYIQVGYAS